MPPKKTRGDTKTKRKRDEEEHSKADVKEEPVKDAEPDVEEVPDGADPDFGGDKEEVKEEGE
jgi:hypothetical protein